MSKKILELSFELVDKIMKIKLPHKDTEVYMALADLETMNSNDDYAETLLNAINTLSERSIKEGFTYILLTCIGTQGLGTRIGVMCDNKHCTEKELEIVCSLIETLTHGMVKCSLINEPFTVLKQCFAIADLSPINF